MKKSFDNNTISEDISGQAKLADSELILMEKEVLPLIPLRGMSVFPGMVIHFDVGRPKSVKALEVAMERNQMALLVTQKEMKKEEITTDDFYRIGCKVKIKQLLKMPDGLVRVLVEVRERREIVDFESIDPFFMVKTEIVKSIYRDTKENTCPSINSNKRKT